MSFIKTRKLKHEFVRRNDEGEIEEVICAISDVDLEVEQGEFVAVLGHNGSGKSTLAKHLNALLYPTEGSVWIDGYDVSEEEHLLDIRKSAGMVFQNPDNQIIAGVVEEMWHLDGKIWVCRRKRSGSVWNSLWKLSA